MGGDPGCLQQRTEMSGAPSLEEHEARKQLPLGTRRGWLQLAVAEDGETRHLPHPGLKRSCQQLAVAEASETHNQFFWAECKDSATRSKQPVRLAVAEARAGQRLPPVRLEVAEDSETRGQLALKLAVAGASETRSQPAGAKSSETRRAWPWMARLWRALLRQEVAEWHSAGP